MTTYEVGKIILGTPWWVWILFTYLIFVGVRATKTRIVYLPKLFIIPAILLYLKKDVIVSPYFAVFGVVGLYTGFVIAKKINLKPISGELSIELPGTYSTLLLLLSFFLIKYLFGYLHYANAEIADEYLFVETSLSALFSCYLLGRSICYLYRYYKITKS